MSDLRHVFTIVEDISTAEGVRLPARAQGDSSGDNHMPAMVAKETSGNYALLELRNEGDAASAVDVPPVMPVKDLSGNLQYINARDEGDAISGVDALPGLIAKDPSSNFAYLKVNADGELIISNEPDGTKIFGDAVVTPASLNSAEDVVTLVLTNDKVFEEIQYRGSSYFPVRWEVVQVDDAAGTPSETQHDSFLTGPGQFSFGFEPQWLNFTAGSTGTINLVLRGTQLTGALSDMHGYIEGIEKP